MMKRMMTTMRTMVTMMLMMINIYHTTERKPIVGNGHAIYPRFYCEFSRG